MLEVVNQNGTSTVWEDLFDTAGAAYEAFEATVAQEGLGAFLDEADAPASPTRH